MTGTSRQDSSKQSLPGQHSFALDNISAQHPQEFPSSARSYADLNYLFGEQEIIMLGQKPNRHKLTQGIEPTKHRRTRSGCYTCRSRRVKCDERHPKCDRCAKGNRECVYPEAQTSAKTTTGSSSKSGRPKVHESPGSSEDEDQDRVTRHLEVIPDEDEHGDEVDQPRNTRMQEPLIRSTKIQSSSDGRSITRHSSETPSLVYDKGSSPTPSTEGSIGHSTFQYLGSSRFPEQAFPRDTESSNLRGDWSHLPPDLQFYLNYFYQNLTFLHYNLKSDHNGFIQILLFNAALRNEPLLYAVVGFSAFQYAIEMREGKIQDFLQYYNKAVSLLLKSLKKGERHSTGTLMAMLQLATIEEYLGDWANLIGHQKAAHEILIELYTPQTIMKTDIGRAIIGWYMRFDVSAGIIGGFDGTLSREWFSYLQEYYEQQISKDPNNLILRYEHQISKIRIIGKDMCALFAAKTKGDISHQQYLIKNAVMTKTLRDWKKDMDQSLLNSHFLITDFSGVMQRHSGEVFNPYKPGVLYGGPLWLTNVCLLDWYAVDLVYGLQTAQAMQSLPDSEYLGRVAQDFCQLYESVVYSPESPKGAAVGLFGSIGIAAFFLPKDEAHSMWFRRKFAFVESQGFVQPSTIRDKMSELFRDNSCMHWWLPNDEMYYPLIRAIRKFVEDRTSVPKNVETKDVQDMKVIFSNLNMSDESDSSPQLTNKGKEPSTDISVAQNSDWPSVYGNMGFEQHDMYGTGFNDEQTSWNDGSG